MNILAIGGSPRRQGNSNSLLRMAVEAAVERGARAEYVYARDLDLEGCRGCDGCKADVDAICVIDDDMHRVYDLMRWADVIVFASPVYFYGLSSWLKKIIDRCYGLMGPGGESAGEGNETTLRIESGKGFYLITSQEELPSYFGYTILAGFVYGMSWLGMVHCGQLVATGVSKASDWEGRADLQAAARELIVVE
jgi:multimeric flavodoxin WrbA